jgi:uncharacterized protein YjgD (DUF1641 family)
MRRPWWGGFQAAAGFGSLIAGLALIDERVRTQIASLLTRRGTNDEITSAGREIREFAMILLRAVQDQAMEHTTLVVFGLAALVLVLFMSRT